MRVMGVLCIKWIAVRGVAHATRDGVMVLPQARIYGVHGSCTMAEPRMQPEQLFGWLCSARRHGNTEWNEKGFTICCKEAAHQ
eukprot:3140047-Amphidinium_carterae.1